MSLTCKFSSQQTFILNIGGLICCLTLYSSGSDSPDNRKRQNLNLKGYGVSNKNKVREEDESDVPNKYNKIAGEDKWVKFSL